MGRTAVGGVPVCDHRGSTNPWERRQIIEDLVAFGQHAIRSIRARDSGKRLCAIAIERVPRDAFGANRKWSGEESEDRDEFHVCDQMKVQVLFAYVSGTTASLSPL